jgi:hypothetical protein
MTVKWEVVMATKIKNLFKQAFAALIEARQKQVDRMIAEREYWKQV